MNVLNERLTLKASGLALMTATLWGGNSVSIKLGLAGIPPVALAGIRFLLGGLVVFAWASLIRIPLRLEGKEKRALLSLVLLFIMQIYLLNVGTRFTLGGRSTIFISTYPFFTATFAHLFIPGDRLTRFKVAGMALSFGGVVLIFAESLLLGRLQHIPGDLLVLVSALLLGARQVYTKRLIQGIHPVKLLLWQAVLSTPIFFLFSAAFEDDTPYRWSPDIVGAILYQGLIIAGFCFILQTHLLRRYRASRLSVFGFATPIFGVLLSSLLLNEGISIGLAGSMLLVGAGIAIVNYEA